MAASLPFTVTVTTLAEPLFVGEAASLVVPGVEGDLTILAHHEPFITRLRKGDVRIVRMSGGETDVFPIEHGLLEVSNNQATVLI